MLYGLLFGAQHFKDDDNFPDWIKKAPVSQEVDEWTARDLTNISWLMTNAITQKSARFDQLLVNPWQDPMDRPEMVAGGMLVAGLMMGVGRGFFMAKDIALRSNDPFTMATAAMATSLFKYGASMGIIGGSLLAGDRIVQHGRRTLAERQGVELSKTQDVERTPLNYAISVATSTSAFTLMDARRPTPLLRNLALWTVPGLVIGYSVGIFKCRVIETMRQDMLDDGARRAFYNTINDDE
eukprot:TRINITY_DN4693_c0_g1_i2.p1 TRINITY_DN4693_c0_g1~~TRINITY_DN4693_c0_g1_i2.p1  ORF type:complete len:266 (+),score=37.27 TRINITY_DN4693_c0_g1_i2:83-799(+)